MLNNQKNKNQPFQFAAQLRKLPIFFKILCAITLVTGLIGIFTDLLIDLFANIPYYTVFRFNFWRIVTGPFIASGFFQATTTILLVYLFMPQFEIRISTILLMIDFLVANIIIQVAYTSVQILFSELHFTKQAGMYSNGMWPMWLVYVVRICYSDNEGSIKLCCFNYTVPKKYYPLALLAFIALWRFTLPWDLIIAAALTYLQCRFFNGCWIKVKRDRLMRLQNILTCINTRSDFISLESCTESKYFCKDQNNQDFILLYADLMNTKQRNITNISEDGSPITTMKGGITIGGTAKVTSIRERWAKFDEENHEVEASNVKDGYNQFQQEV